ncbi:hypothetical protein [Muricauda brasiliensis]|uniref:hypothetical protein n=1 Tax=Muricauda brasiliensis TaxID=2162892 RepID=UPI000D341B16|nr:hypothetical protein [Muricauda brasiliensis]
MGEEDQIDWTIQLHNEVFDKVWYEGKYSLENGYHSVTKAVYVQFKSGLVLKFSTEKKERKTAGHHLVIEEKQLWQKEKRYVKDLKEVTALGEYGPFIKSPVISCDMEVQNVGENIIAPFTRMMNRMYSQYLMLNIQLMVDDEYALCIAASKVINGQQMINFYNQLTVFFQKSVYTDYKQKTSEYFMW